MVVACLSCGNQAVLYGWPLVDVVAGVFVAWAAFTVMRWFRVETPPRRSAARLAEVGFAVAGVLVLAFGTLTLSWRMWMLIVAAVWGAIQVARIGKSLLQRKPPPLVASLCLVFLIATAGHAQWVRNQPDYLVEWLGTLPPHGRNNSGLAVESLKQADETAPLLVQAFRDELTGVRGRTNPYRLSVLARVLQQLHRDAANEALREGLTWRTGRDTGAVDDAAHAAVVLSYAVNMREDGFDTLWSHYERRRNHATVSDSELLIWRAALFVCDSARAREAFTEDELTVPEGRQRYGALRAYEFDLEQIVESRGSSLPDDEDGVANMLGRIYPQIDLHPLR